ncbi:hypothetical protein WMF12_15020 [Sorangium sp. So ce363]
MAEHDADLGLGAETFERACDSADHVPVQHRDAGHRLQLGAARPIAGQNRHAVLDRLHETGACVGVGRCWKLAAAGALASEGGASGAPSRSTLTATAAPDPGFVGLLFGGFGDALVALAASTMLR